MQPDTISTFVPLAVYACAAVAIIVLMLVVSYLLGERHREKETDVPFESGIAVTGSARIRFSARFYLIAMFFVIFDLETAFLFGWAIAVPELGWGGYVEAMVFVALLVAALVYLWRTGGLTFASVARQAPDVKGGHSY